VAAAFGCLLALACGGDGGTDSQPTVVSVTVTSPIGQLMAVGRTVQLSATAQDVLGQPVSGVQFQWQSSNTNAATVSGSGLVTAVAVGFATITATAEGIDGNFTLQVVEVDLAGIAAVIDDPFTAVLAANLSATRRTGMEAALSDCSDAAAAGDISGLQSCLAAAQAEVDAATELDDLALAAVIGLLLDHADRLLDV
jgi:hypothetical protein